MVLKEKSNPNFRMIKANSSHRKISLNRKSSLPIKSKVPISKNLILEDGDFVNRFGEEACKWLSSGTVSLSSCLENVTFIMSDPSLDEWLFFLLSLVQNPSPLVNKYIACFDGSKVNPIEEAYLVMKKTLLQEDVTKGDEEEVLAWLSSTKSGETNSIVSCSLRNCSDLKEHFFLSLMKLDEESLSWWDSDSDTDSDEFLSSSSSFSSISKTVTTSSSSDCVSEDLNFGELNFHEPLVWPFDKKRNWRNREGKWDDFFVMSPCRQEHKTVEKDIERDSKNNSSKHVNRAKKIRNIQKTKATLRGALELKSRKISLKVVPLDTVDFRIESTTENLTEKCKTLEDDFFYQCGKHTIESFLGLEEFDGQEGIEKEFLKDDDFYLQDLLR